MSVRTRGGRVNSHFRDLHDVIILSSIIGLSSWTFQIYRLWLGRQSYVPGSTAPGGKGLCHFHGYKNLSLGLDSKSYDPGSTIRDGKGLSHFHGYKTYTSDWVARATIRGPLSKAGRDYAISKALRQRHWSWVARATFRGPLPHKLLKALCLRNGVQSFWTFAPRHQPSGDHQKGKR